MTKKVQRMTPIIVLPQIVPNPHPQKSIFWGGGLGTIRQGRICGRIALPPTPRNKGCVSPVAAPPPPSPFSSSRI